MIEMASKQIEPSVFVSARLLADTINTLAETGVNAVVAKKRLEKINERLNKMDEAIEKLRKSVDDSSGIRDKKEKAMAYRERVFFAMSDLRSPADKIEMLVDKQVWPFPTYGELLFYVDEIEVFNQ